MSTKSRTRSKTRLSRALGIPLTPKAAKYLEKRPYAPGEHGRTKRKADSDYAVRLREKQRLRASTASVRLSSRSSSPRPAVPPA